MSSISFPLDIWNTVKKHGTTEMYTCPSNKKAIILITFHGFSYENRSQGLNRGGTSPENDNFPVPVETFSETYCFLETCNPGEYLTFSEGGSGVIIPPASSFSVSNVYAKNSVNQQVRTYSGSIPSLVGTDYKNLGYNIAYSANISYTVLEFPI